MPALEKTVPYASSHYRDFDADDTDHDHKVDSKGTGNITAAQRADPALSRHTPRNIASTQAYASPRELCSSKPRWVM